jgi:hypothetical protein
LEKVGFELDGLLYEGLLYDGLLGDDLADFGGPANVVVGSEAKQKAARIKEPATIVKEL